MYSLVPCEVPGCATKEHHNKNPEHLDTCVGAAVVTSTKAEELAPES